MDIELHLLSISEKEINLKEAKASFSIVYEHYRRFVYNVVMKSIDYKSHKEEFAKTIVNQVFQHIWKSPLDWEFKPDVHESPDSGYKAYISTVAYYKRLEHLRKSEDYLKNEIPKIDDTNNDWLFKLEDEEFKILDNELSEKNNVVDNILSNLEPKKRDIIRVYFLHYEEGKKMRSETIEMMESMFETTWDNIRQIVSRTKRKIKEEINKGVKV